MAGRQWVLSGAVAGVMAVMLSACGDDSSPTGPSNGGGGGGTRVETDTITITSTGVSPRDIIIDSGMTVKFVNNDSGPHEPSSNPHPAHTDCPDLNVGTVAPGATGTSGPMPSGRTCGFHDHINFGAGSLQGSVQVR